MPSPEILPRGFFQRLLGIPATALPRDPGCWSLVEGRLRIDLSRAGELAEPGGALRVEGPGLPCRVLVLHGDDGEFHAFRNRCRHIGGRRLDPVPGTSTVQCCSVSKSTFDYSGRCVHGPAKKAVERFPVDRDGDSLVVTLEPEPAADA